MNRYLLSLSLLLAPLFSYSQFTCEDLGNLVDSGGQEEKTIQWSLGSAPGFERDFRLSWQMYSITDRIIIEYTGRNGPVTFDSGFVSGTGNHLIQLSSSGSQVVKVTVNSGGGNSGTAWNYRIEEDSANITDITLTTAVPSEAWRVPFQGVNRNASLPLTFDLNSGGDTPFDGYSQYLSKVFRFTAPNDSEGCRIRTPAGVYLSVKETCIARPAERVPYSSLNLSNRNTVVFGTISGQLNGGKTYYITVAVPMGLVALSGSTTFSPGNLEIDSFSQGYWEKAESSALVSGETLRVMVGIEPAQSGETLPASGTPLNVVSHGRTDTPTGMSGVGGAADSRWYYSDTFYVNWSDGSFWNDVGLDGSRFIKPSAQKVGDLLKHEGYTTVQNIDFIGHSWGTYVGFEIPTSWSSRVVVRKKKRKRKKNGKRRKPKKIYSLVSVNGRYNRFFVLDPASHAPFYKFGVTGVPATPFASRAVYSFAMYGHGPSATPDGLFGSPRNAALAHDGFSVGMWSVNPFTHHSEPIRVLQNMLNFSQPQFHYDETWWMFWAILEDTGILHFQHNWERDQYGWVNVVANYGYLDANLFTNGSGLVTEMKYVSKTTGNTVEYP